MNREDLIEMLRILENYADAQIHHVELVLELIANLQTLAEKAND